jgi:hypothetical protein
MLKPGPSLLLFPFLLLFLFLSHLKVSAGNDNPLQGPRASALGGASVCLTDVWSTEHNQAALGFLKYPQVAAAYENGFGLKELQLAGFCFALPSRRYGTFGIYCSSFGNPSYQENKCGLSYARAFGSRISAGVQLDYLNTRIGEGYGSHATAAAEIGILATVVKGLTLGVHLNNPGRQKLAAYDDERYPTTLRAGLLYSSSPQVLFALETEKDNLHPPIFRSGIEYSQGDLFHLRTGICTNPLLFCFGFGFKKGNMLVDFSSNWHSVLGISPGIGLGYVFK